MVKHYIASAQVWYFLKKEINQGSLICDPEIKSVKIILSWMYESQSHQNTNCHKVDTSYIYMMYQPYGNSCSDAFTYIYIYFLEINRKWDNLDLERRMLRTYMDLQRDGQKLTIHKTSHHNLSQQNSNKNYFLKLRFNLKLYEHHWNKIILFFPK